MSVVFYFRLLMIALPLWLALGVSWSATTPIDQQGSESTKPFSTSHKRVQSATVILGPRGSFSFNRRQTEIDLPKIGCVFNITASDDLASLLSVLDRAAILEVETVIQQPDARFGIWLRAIDGTEEKYIFGHRLRDGPANGIHNDTRSVTSNEDFEEDMRIWAMHLKSTHSTPPCDPNENPTQR